MSCEKLTHDLRQIDQRYSMFAWTYWNYLANERGSRKHRPRMRRELIPRQLLCGDRLHVPLFPSTADILLRLRQNFSDSILSLDSILERATESSQRRHFGSDDDVDLAAVCQTADYLRGDPEGDPSSVTIQRHKRPLPVFRRRVRIEFEEEVMEKAA
jgi:hypothetical protein